jgi:hypothetical protein
MLPRGFFEVRSIFRRRRMAAAGSSMTGQSPSTRMRTFVPGTIPAARRSAAGIGIRPSGPTLSIAVV